jgi:[FeFe] hydrogenase H-cluster maturation GTPase HydF
VHNKSDLEPLLDKTIQEIRHTTSAEIIDFSTEFGIQLEAVVEAIKKTIPKTAYVKPSLFGDLLKPKDVVLLITPIDSEAPEGRMILPQVMALRDVLDNDCICIILKESELEDFMKLGIRPALAVTDSQAFGFVSKIIPENIPLTGFSIVFARARANFEKYIVGTKKIGELKDNDKILILESCSHHVSCDDIGRSKLPKSMTEFTGKKLHFEVVPGMEKTPENISEYALVVQCGGCVVTQKQLQNRLKPAIETEVAVTNYGMAIAFLNGIFDRAIAPFLKNERIPIKSVQ